MYLAATVLEYTQFHRYIVVVVTNSYSGLFLAKFIAKISLNSFYMTTHKLYHFPFNCHFRQQLVS